MIPEPTPTAPSIKRSAKKAKKRIRTIFSHKQLKTLEYYFRQQPYMVGQDRVNLAKDLSLSEAQVSVVTLWPLLFVYIHFIASRLRSGFR